MNGKREYGDYQTPIDFAEKVCLYLKNYRHVMPSVIIEPTCGVGNFLKSSMIFEADEYYGIEIDPEYCNICKNSINSSKFNIINSDFFSISSKNLIKDDRQILIVGNPPWVTNSTLSALGSENSPIKANFKGLKGIDALTGSSNFDICEYIILRLINEYRDTNTIIAMLCKTSVARNVFKELKRTSIAFSSCDILDFDASKVFGINANACVLFIQLEVNPVSSDICNVYDFDFPEKVKSQFGYSNGQFFSNLYTSSEDYDGQCCFEWRQGVKHDCSMVMELTRENGSFKNGQNKTVQIEDGIVYPLIKSSMFKTPIIHSFSKFVIVTQKKIREETEHLKKEFPMTWSYLNENTEFFEKRKSSIYRGAPPFSMFGIGDYSYSKYKVGVSGFYKHPLFSMLYSDDDKPVMTDDTSYFICFDSYDSAYVAMLLLNSDKVQRFLTGIAFLDAKRPYTKKVLERIDFDKIVDSLNIDDLIKVEEKLKLTNHVTSSMYNAFKSLLGIKQLRFA
ncbi:MAG: SAM-dependent methyltransferase [Eubacterium sp.]|nr:SAM-dependent methyltransferase [Eubacterium sp.]